jgi:hypothetical protein
VKQPFDWMEPNIPAAYAKTFGEKRREARRRELEDRASLLMRLHFPPEEIKARLRAHLAFDGDLDEEDGLDEIVDGLAARRGITRHGPPPVG